MDETTDAKGRLVAGFIISSLEKRFCGPFLTNIAEFKKGDAETIALFIVDSLVDFYQLPGKNKQQLLTVFCLNYLYFGFYN